LIHSMLIEKLGPFLTELSSLMESYQKGDPAFPNNACDWLSRAEKAMSALRLPEGSEMSGLRGRVLKASDSLIAREERASRSTIRSARNAAAAEAIERGEEIVRTRIRESQQKLQQLEDKLCEGMTALLLQITLPSLEGSLNTWLNQVWFHLQQQESTKALALYLSASLGMVDRLFILNQVLGRITEQPQTRSVISTSKITTSKATTSRATENTAATTNEDQSEQPPSKPTTIKH
jgi:hypothetical protein